MTLSLRRVPAGMGVYIEYIGENWPCYNGTALWYWISKDISSLILGIAINAIIDAIGKTFRIAPCKWPIMRGFDVSYVVSLHDMLKKQSNCRWFERSSSQYDVTVMNAALVGDRDLISTNVPRADFEGGAPGARPP